MWGVREGVGCGEGGKSGEGRRKVEKGGGKGGEVGGKMEKGRVRDVEVGLGGS